MVIYESGRNLKTQGFIINPTFTHALLKEVPINYWPLGCLRIKDISIYEICYLAHILLKLTHLDFFHSITSNYNLYYRIVNTYNGSKRTSIPWQVERSQVPLNY